MLSESLIKQSKQLENLQLEDYKKVINYSINLILNRENQMKLNQFIQIDQQRGDQLTSLCLSLITALAKYRNSSKQFDADLNLLFISKQRKEYLRQKIQAQLYELRKIIYSEDLSNITHFKDMEWRFQSEITSKTNKNSFVPNIFLNFVTQQNKIKSQTAVNCDFANLKNLHQSLLEAMKLHNSNKFKAARNSLA